MHEPWLFWSGVAFATIAATCFVLAMRGTSQRASLMMEISAQVIGGTAGLLMGYEIGFRTAAKDTLGLQTNTAVGGVLLLGGALLLINAVVKAFQK